MAMNLRAVREKVAVCTVTWEDETVDVGYFPAAMTPALVERVQEVAKAENLDVMGAMLEPVLAWWDVLDDDGNRLPTTAEQIRELPLAFLTRVMTTVQGAMRPPAERA